MGPISTCCELKFELTSRCIPGPPSKRKNIMDRRLYPDLENDNSIY